MIRKLLVNTSSNVSVMVVKILITFVLTPVIVHNLGKYDYGLWEMLAAVLGYMGLLDLGLKPALSRFAAKYKAEEDRESLLQVYSSGLFFMGAIGILLCCIFVMWALFLPDTVAKEDGSVSHYAALLVIIGVQLVFKFPGFVAESFLEGFQKYYLKNNLTIVLSLIGAVIIYSFINQQNGLVLLAFVSSLSLSIKYVLFGILLAMRSSGGLIPDWRCFNLHTLGGLMGFGFKSFIQGISARVQDATDSLIIGLILGPATVPFYSIPANLVRYLRTLGQLLTHAFMPFFSELSAKSEKEKLLQFYLRGNKYILGLIIPLAAGICIVGGPFIGVWIGPEFREKGELIIFLLIIFSVTPMLNPFGNRYLTAIGKHGIFAKFAPIAAVGNLGLSLALILPLGVEGVALASAIPVLIITPIYLKYACNQLGIKLSRYVRASILPSFLPTLLMFMAVGAVRLSWGLNSYAMIGAAICLGACIYFPMFWFLALRSNERVFIMRRIPGLSA